MFSPGRCLKSSADFLRKTICLSVKNSLALGFALVAITIYPVTIITRFIWFNIILCFIAGFHGDGFSDRIFMFLSPGSIAEIE